MKRYFVCLICLCLFSGLAMSASEKMPILISRGKNIDSFVPEGWKLIGKVSGDLNNDGLADLAGVMELNVKQEKSQGEAPPRVLFIALQEAKGQYRLAIQTQKAIFRGDEGGAWGDPFAGLAIDRGSILLNFYGGSNYRWAYTYRFRYQSGGWYLIGATIDTFYASTGEGTSEDYNLLTGKMIMTTTFGQGKKQKKIVNRGKKKLLNLNDFDVHSKIKF